MKIRTGFEISYESSQPTPMVLMLSIHPSRFHDLLTPQLISFDPPTPFSDYRDGFGNVCTRIVTPPGRLTISTDFVISDSGEPDSIVPNATQHPVEDLPNEVVAYLLGSRYCETDSLSETAWSLFGNTPLGWARVQAICDYVHDHISFGYEYTNPTKSARDAFIERRGVCRDFTHLAVAFCRCMNIPTRYCTGYLGDIGIPPVPCPMDFSAWFEVYLGGRWHAFDARHNTPRIGRILMAYGRDATDVAISTSFGRSSLVGFKVHTDEVRADLEPTS